MEKLTQRAPELAAQVHIFDTFFYSKLTTTTFVTSLLINAKKSASTYSTSMKQYQGRVRFGLQVDPILQHILEEIYIDTHSRAMVGLCPFDQYACVHTVAALLLLIGTLQSLWTQVTLSPT